MAETRLKLNSQLQKSVIPESVPVTNSINEQEYQAPINAGEVLGFDGLTTEFRPANSYVEFATQSEVDAGSVNAKPIAPDTLSGTVVPLVIGKPIANISNKVIEETVTTMVDNLDGTYTYTSEDGTTTIIGDGSLVNYNDTTIATKHKIGEIVDQAGNIIDVNESDTTIANTISGHKIADYTNESAVTVDINETVTSLSQNTTTSQISFVDENGTTSNAQVVSTDAGNEITVGTDGGSYFVSEAIKIPTPRIWSKNIASSLTAGQDVGALSTFGWIIPEIYAQQFSRDTDTWRDLNPTYELLVHKKVNKPSIGYTLKGKKWVHPVNLNVGSTTKKYAAGATFNANTGTQWQNRRTEWPVDISTLPTLLNSLDPHDFISYSGTDTNTAGINPIIGAYKINSFKDSFWFPPKRGRVKGNIKLAFSVRIRIDNPAFQSGVSNQEPYLYGEPSTILVFKPRITNMWDGSTFDSLGRPVAEQYAFNWIASEENIKN